MAPPRSYRYYWEDFPAGSTRDFGPMAVTREAMDNFALRSHQKAVEAQEMGRFKPEIVPVPVTGRKGEVTVVDTDEGPRKDTTLEALAKLKPAFKENGKVTPGNSSPMNDGGAAVVISSRAYAEKNKLKPMARVVGYGGRIEFDVSKPDGAPRKLLDVERLRALGWRAQIVPGSAWISARRPAASSTFFSTSITT